jgi:hypothetical protein
MIPSRDVVTWFYFVNFVIPSTVCLTTSVLPGAMTHLPRRRVVCRYLRDKCRMPLTFLWWAMFGASAAAGAGREGNETMGDCAPGDDGGPAAGCRQPGERASERTKWNCRHARHCYIGLVVSASRVLQSFTCQVADALTRICFVWKVNSRASCQSTGHWSTCHNVEPAVARQTGAIRFTPCQVCRCSVTSRVVYCARYDRVPYSRVNCKLHEPSAWSPTLFAVNLRTVCRINTSSLQCIVRTAQLPTSARAKWKCEAVDGPSSPQPHASQYHRH